jgi:Zn-dependent peptidase ImmA (M78 family)/transcriptional regulator with XRE-family HTH domain
MNLGTPGFSGRRLTEAREARGLSGTSLAELVGINSANISQYEHGKQSPSPDVMDRICEKLSLDRRYFLRSPANHQTDGVYFRSMSAATKPARTKAIARYGWLKEIVAYLRRYLDFPKINLPIFTVPSDPTKLPAELIEEVASECRRYWQLGDGPVSNMVLLLENNGTVVTRARLDAETLDAFSQWNNADGTPYVVLGGDKEAAVRSRFDAAHELGHLLLHREADNRQINAAGTHQLMEKQAHRFAGAFLLPADRFCEEVYSVTIDGLRTLKPYWRTSIGTMISRCEDLGMVTSEQARRLWIGMNRRGWKRREPLDDSIAVEDPRLLKRSMQMLVEEGIKTRDSILYELRLPASDVEELTGTQRGFFSGLELFPTLKVRDTQQGGARVANSGIIVFPAKGDAEKP